MEPSPMLRGMKSVNEIKGVVTFRANPVFCERVGLRDLLGLNNNAKFMQI